VGPTNNQVGESLLPISDIAKISFLMPVHGCFMEEKRKTGNLPARWQARRRLLCLFLAFGLVLAFGGCTRAFYRRQADKEVSDVLQEKDKYPQWKIEQYHVYADPRARFADPSNPDRTPMPPDDEPAYELSPHPQRPGH